MIINDTYFYEDHIALTHEDLITICNMKGKRFQTYASPGEFHIRSSSDEPFENSVYVEDGQRCPIRSLNEDRI